MYRIIEKLNYKDFKEKYFNNNYFKRRNLSLQFYYLLDTYIQGVIR